MLLAKGAKVDYADPYFPRFPSGRRHSLELESVPLTAASIAAYDAVVLITDHTAFPYQLIHRSARLIIDSRNAFRSRGLHGANVVLA